MSLDRPNIANLPAHPKAGAYVTTIAGHYVYGRPGCLACPELGLWGYVERGGLRHAILRAIGTPIVGNVVPFVGACITSR